MPKTRFRNAECHNSGKLGHIAPICKLKSDKKIIQRNSQANKKPFGAKHQYPNRGQRTNKVAATATNGKQKLPGEMEEIPKHFVQTL